jgi:type IV pilus assembly protein PilA
MLLADNSLAERRVSLVSIRRGDDSIMDRSAFIDMSPARCSDPRLGASIHGFTMLEIAVVLAIVGILAIIAVPSFHERIIRNQIVSALPLADIVKSPIALSWATAQALPADNAAVGLPPAEKIVNNYVSAVSVRDGAIDITFGNSVGGAIKGKILTLRPAIVADAPIVPVAWVCGFADGPGQMTVKGENRTDIPAKYLPFDCRAPDR